MVRKGSPVRVRQRASGTALQRGSLIRSGSDDHFLALPSEKGSSMAADGRCAAVGCARERVPISATVPTRYTRGAKFLLRPRGEGVGEAFDADHRGLRWRAGDAVQAWFMTCGLSPYSRRAREQCRRGRAGSRYRRAQSVAVLDVGHFRRCEPALLGLAHCRPATRVASCSCGTPSAYAVPAGIRIHSGERMTLLLLVRSASAGTIASNAKRECCVSTRSLRESPLTRSPMKRAGLPGGGQSVQPKRSPGPVLASCENVTDRDLPLDRHGGARGRARYPGSVRQRGQPEGETFN